MAWNMSAEKRRALVKLQLRDKHGRWIEMGRGVKWYSSKFKREIGGTVVDGKGSNAIVRLNKEDGGSVVSVPAHNIEVIDSKATLAPKGDKKSNLDTPEFEKPKAVSDTPAPVKDTSDEGPAALEERTYPADVDENDPNSYKATKTADGKFYFGRADGEGIYTPANKLQVGDELIAPDGTDESKPFSIGAKWNRRGVERVAEGKGIGTVESIVPDRYAIVKLPEGYSAPDGRDTVTVGLRNDVIKATPGLKKSLESAGFKFDGNGSDGSESAPNNGIDLSQPVEPATASEGEQWYNKKHKEITGLPMGDPRYEAWGSAHQNAQDSEREGTVKKDTPEWYDLFRSSYESALEENQSHQQNQPEPDPVDTPSEPVNAPSDPVDTPSEPKNTEATSEKDVVEGVSRVAQDMEDINDSGLQGEELSAALDEAKYTFTGSDGLDYTVSGNPEGDGEWTANVTDLEGNDVGSWIPSKYDSLEAMGKDIHATINKIRSTDPAKNGQEDPTTEPVDAPSAPQYNENGLTAEEQKTADALTRMIARAEAQGNFEKADQLSNQLAQMMREGEGRKNNAPEPAKTPEPPAAPEPANTPEPAQASEPPQEPNLIEPDPVDTPAAPEPATDPVESLIQSTDDGFNVRQSETHPNMLEVVAPDGVVARRANKSDADVATQIENGLADARKAYASREQQKAAIAARKAEVAALEPFDPINIPAPASAFRTSDGIREGDRLLTASRPNGTQGILQLRKSAVDGQQEVQLSGKSALVKSASPIMGQNKTSMGKVVGTRVEVEHSDGQIETVDLYSNRGGTNDKSGVFMDTPEFRQELAKNDPNTTEGQNGTESGSNGGNSGAEGTTEGQAKSGEGQNVPGSTGGDGGSGNDPASGGDGTDSGEGASTGPESGQPGQPLTQAEIDALPDDELIIDGEDGSTLAKNDQGEWYSVAHFLDTGDKEGLPSDMLDGRAKRREGTRKYGEEETDYSVNYFVSNSYRNVNDFVRNGNDPYRNLPGYSDRVVDIMDDAIAHSPLERDTTLFRGLQINAAEAEKFTAGSIINDKGFTSLSKRKSIAEEFAKHSAGLTGVPAPEDHVPVVLHVNLPKGHNVLPVDYSKTEHDFSHQQEHIMGRDSSFKVDSVEVSEKDGKKSYTLQVSPAKEQDLQTIPKADPIDEPTNNNVDWPEGIERRTPEALPGEKFPPTQQQQDVIDAVLGGLDTIVQAKAGAGKTTTLEAISRRIQKYKPGEDQVLYIAFNTTVAAEAKRRMPSNVESRTGHSLSYRWSPDWMKDRMGGKKAKTALRNGQDIADHIGIEGDLKIDSMEDPLEPYDQAVLAMKAVDTYAFSADDEIGIQHFPEDFHDRGEVSDKLVAYAQAIWADLSNENGQIKFSQDAARKHWALSRPDLSQSTGGWTGANVVFIDEAQDTPPVLAKVVADQHIQKVVVGDADQAIYGFTGATDYLSQAEGDIELPLNKSWRFGPQVADAGNRFLQLLNSKGRVVGGGPESTIEPGMTDPDAILVRSNAGMVGEILSELGKGRTVGVPAKTKKDLVNLFNHADQLKNNFKGSAFHEDLAAYKTWKEFAKAAEDGDDQKATMIYNLIEAYGIPELKTMIGRVQDPDESVENRGEKHPLSSPIGALFAKIKVERKGGDVILAGGTWAFNAKLKETLEERGLSGLGWRWEPKDKVWIAKGKDGEEKEAVYKRLEQLMLDQDVDVNAPAIETKKPDVIISTAHKAKGLEWSRVKIGKDFRGPQKGQDGNLIMPNDDELRLAYVAVTRAEKALDPGSLAYVFAHTSENGGADEHGNILGVDAPNVDPVNSPNEPDPVNTPEPVNTPDPAPVTAPEPDPIDAPDPEPAPVVPDPVDVPAEPDPTPVAPEPTPAPVEPEPAPAPAPAPVEPAPAPAEPQPVPGYNANGYTAGEQERVDYLENLLAKVYKGEADGDIDALEGELDNLYAAGESRLGGVDVPEIKTAVDPTPTPVEPVNTPAPAPAPTTPTAPEPAATPARRTRTNMSGVKVHALGGEELVEGMEVRHPKYTGTVIRVIPSAGTVRIKKQDGTEVIARGHKVSVITPGAEPTPAPAVQNLAPGSAGVDPTTGLPYFVGRDGTVFQIGDTVTHAKKGEGTVKAIYVGATSVSVDWADGSNSRSQAKALYGKDGGGENAPEPTNAPSVEPVDPEPTTPEPTAPAPVEPEPVVPEPTAPAAPAVDPVETGPASKSKLSVKGGEIEGGDPVGKSGPVSPHGEPLPGDQTDLMMLSMLYPQGSVITYYTKTGGVKFRLKKVDGDVWHELKENGFINENAYQYIPPLSRTLMAVKPNWEGKRDSRIGHVPDNEEFLNSIPIGGTVTTADHWDGKPRTWTKVAPGYWKSPDQGGAFNNSLHRYGISDFSGIDDSFTTPDYKAEGWSEYAGGKDRALKLFKLTNGSEVSFSRSPNVHYVKENGKWSEVVRGKRTGTILNTLNAQSNSYSDGPAFVNVANAATKEDYVPKRVKPENIVGDPKEIDAVFGTDIDNYSGVETLFRQYDRETSPLNALNLPPTPPRWKFADVAETTNSRGDKIVIGARAYDLQGNYIGKVKSIRHPESSFAEDGKAVELMHTPDQGIVPLSTETMRVNPEDMTTVRTKNWDTSADLDFSDYTRVKDIEDQMNETYGGINFKLAPRATDIRTARELSNTVSKIFNKYPQLQEAMSFVGTQPYGKEDSANAAMFASGPSEFGVTGNITDNTYEGRYGHVGARMAFNVSRSYESFVSGKRQSQKTRWNNNVDEGREVEATVTHEFGHVLDFFTGVMSEEKILEFASEVLGRKVTQNNSELGQELFDNKFLSGYSLKWGNIYPVELVAESFQDVEMNGVNASPLSKLVHQELMRRLATQANASVESGISNAAPSEGVTV